MAGRSQPVLSHAAAFDAGIREAKSNALNAAEEVLLREACRLIDRLDGYDAAIGADPESPLVAEARQTVAELRQVVKALNVPAAKAEGKRSAFDELAAKREKRTG